MFKSIKNYFTNRRDLKIRERLAIKAVGTPNDLEACYNFIATGHCENCDKVVYTTVKNPTDVRIAL
jgi:hypothetical protein